MFKSLGDFYRLSFYLIFFFLYYFVLCPFLISYPSDLVVMVGFGALIVAAPFAFAVVRETYMRVQKYLEEK